MSRTSEYGVRACEAIWVPVFYQTGALVMDLLLKLFSELSVTGLDSVPASGPLIVAANHLNLADPPLLATVLPRRLRFMAKQELFDRGLTGFCVRSFGAFPVRRLEADLGAIRNARKFLATGEALTMFPEGHRSGGKGLIPAHPGTAFLALSSGVPVLPVGITGTEQIDSPRVVGLRPRIAVAVGQPLSFRQNIRVKSPEVHAATEQIMCAIAALLPAKYRGVYTYCKVD